MKIEDFNFAGHKAIVRVDFNVPLDENGNVTDDTRIRGALPTLKKVLADGGALIMMSHMGKPKGKVKPELSLSQIVKNVSDALGVEVKFAKDCGNADAEAAALKPGEALLLENLRFYPEEEGKPVGVEKGTPEFDAAKAEMKERQKKFAAKLASYADVYVMDAFGTAHRKHASTAVIADSFDKDHKMLGFLMEKEVKAVDAVLGNIKRPFTAIMGGSKAIADAIAEATKEGAFSLIGGGDSVACINKFGLADQVSYISTGGGALLEAIEGKVLPGVAAIEK
uniref:phosphoglycerate kinase n=1 Tax=Segatella hominis TaxID=2518605 RepID=UPI004028BF17